MPPPLSPKTPPAKKPKLLTDKEAESLFTRCEDAIRSVASELEEATELAKTAGLSVKSDLTHYTENSAAAAAAATTAGHSNTDHIVVWTGDRVTDRIAELKRNMLTRIRAQQPESKGEDRWDKPRIPGERRRRIVREKDAPGAPPEPPPTGYVAYVAQITCKIRHDRPKERHDQARVMQEISKMWRNQLTDSERKFYSDFADEAREEYQKQHLQYRATGKYSPSETCEKLQDVGPWVHKRPEFRNALEREISTYDTVVFPLRPPELDEAYKRREEESKRKRKLKVKGLLNPDGAEKKNEENKKD